MYSQAFSVDLCQRVDRKASHIPGCSAIFRDTVIPNVVHLKLDARLEKDHEFEGTDDVGWLRLLYQFSTVKMLQVSYELAGHVSLALPRSLARQYRPINIVLLSIS